MRKLAVLLGAAGLALQMTSAFADNTMPAPANSNLTIGVIDLTQVLQKSPQMKIEADKLKAQFEPRKEKIMSAQKQLDADQEKLKRDASVMSQADSQQLQNKVANERRDLQRMQGDYVQDVQTAQQQAMQKVLGSVDKIVADIAQKGHYDLIFQKNAVAFTSNRVDITPQVIEKLK